MQFAGFTVKLNLPYIGGIEGEWVPNEAEKKAAWEMYVELVTRVPVVQIGTDEGILREALSSVYSLFDTTRKILREYGPDIARSKGEGTMSFGYLAVVILNTVLRPILAKWHPLLQDYESTRPQHVSIVEHERQWERYAELRQEIEQVRIALADYATLLAKVAGVPSLIIEEPKQNA